LRGGELPVRSEYSSHKNCCVYIDAAQDIPQPRTLEEYSSREFAGEELIFSSFTYLIDLGKIIGPVLALGTEPREPFEPGVINADASLMNWGLYLPKQKHLVVEDPGKVDEILFQAHMLCNT
jgi:hypothetical protein